MKFSPRKVFSIFATGEAITWGLLLSALVVRSLTPDLIWLVSVAGGLHGAMFLGYASVATLVGINQRWKVGRLILGILLAIVPFATVPFERRLLRKSLLEGVWRTAESANPRDKYWIDRLFRWFINRPLFLIALLLMGLAVLYSVLLWLGPPSEWGTRFH